MQEAEALVMELVTVDFRPVIEIVEGLEIVLGFERIEDEDERDLEDD